MAGAQIGALRVSLGLDSAQFTSGLKKSQNDLSGFSKMAAGIGVALAAAAASAAVAIGYAIKKSADHADELAKTAQKAGVTVEALSRLEWAGRLADVSLSELSIGLKKLSQNLVDVAMGTGEKAKTAFSALGIAVTDANGKIRASDAVMADIAEAFSKMEDGTVKTALAVTLFGKAGAEMIPLLNAGKTGLREAASEADRLGLTLDTNTAKAAERFNDNLTRLDGVVEGISNRIMAEAVPSLVQLTDTLADPAFQTAISNAVTMFLNVANAIGQVVAAAYNFSMMFPTATNIAAEVARVAKQRSDAYSSLRSQLDDGSGGLSGFDMSAFYGGGTTKTTANSGLNIDALLTGSKEVSKMAEEAARVFASTRTEAEKYSDEMERLNKLYTAGAIDSDTYTRAVIQAQDAFSATDEEAKKLAESLKEMKDYAQGLVLDGINPIMDALWDGTDVWGAFAQAGIDALKDISKELVNSGIKGLFNLNTGKSQPIDLMGGGGNSIFSFFGSLLGFADGGYGKVGGSGGTDSQLFMAKATPGEPYAFGDDALRGIGGGGQVINISLSSTVNADGAGIGAGDIKRLLDQRDRDLLAQVPLALAEAQLHRKM